jgi:Co-chaperonin GroES (HSP10)
MNIKPLGKRVLVELAKTENRSKSGLILTEEIVQIDNYGKISEKSDEVDNLKIGDFIIFDKEKALEVRNSSEVKYIVNIEDIYAKVGD